MSTAQINYLNIGLMLVSLAAAMTLPFEVFLFSYAVLGPLHYLTEISWLHDRRYFTERKWDGMVLLGITFLAGAGSVFVMGRYVVKPIEDFMPDLFFAAFGLCAGLRDDQEVVDTRYRVAGGLALVRLFSRLLGSAGDLCDLLAHANSRLCIYGGLHSLRVFETSSLFGLSFMCGVRGLCGGVLCTDARHDQAYGERLRQE